MKYQQSHHNVLGRKSKKKWILIILAISFLQGCSNIPGYYRSPPKTCDGAPGCAVSAIFDGAIHTKRPSTKCADMAGKQKERCDVQVSAIKSAIKKHKKTN
ncbi:hypothetical protein [Thalassotalea piscium]|uniref:Lipoprotein n=1 Tax=Thalassotalea piscium TaxID=1230533 RepID=A0A7X0TTM6_9GAMM|nr:hypothetical protein [Thalassotalea piscium]MBB6543284.1 hypothetical protein [Thalassotalea piscium]